MYRDFGEWFLCVSECIYLYMCKFVHVYVCICVCVPRTRSWICCDLSITQGSILQYFTVFLLTSLLSLYATDTAVHVLLKALVIDVHKY